MSATALLSLPFVACPRCWLWFFSLRPFAHEKLCCDRRHPALPTCAIEAALAPGPIWDIDPRALAAAGFSKAGAASIANAVKLGGGCSLGSDFADCFDAYIASAAAGYTPTSTQAAMAGLAGIAGPSPETPNQLATPGVLYALVC